MQATHSRYDIGSIYWLPPRNKIPVEYLYATVHIDAGCFDHPVLVLWVDPLRTEAIVLLITSFGGKDLLLRHPHDARARSFHLPIYPSDVHPDTGSRLFLRDGARLPRNSYVKTEHQRTVKTVLLVPTRHETCILRKKSYKELVKRIGFHPPVAKPPRKTSGTQNMSRDYGEWPDLASPAVEQRATPTPERRFVAYVQKALPSRQPPQPLTAPFLQHTAINSPHTSIYQTERLPLLQPVQSAPYLTQRPRTYDSSPQASDQFCAQGYIVVIVLLGIIAWVLWQMTNA